ncbi:uncharacterized protein DUF2848 [Salsuginibacillus halophilus]|uniref:Uncharacterized protein DUF2848 n=1 Tax=Salsuginibacillus halophilus TaxID=517424 RepID=A0A2P8HQY1_9BACI|nr:DUF2848 family protein [Salsuginibacillus halophilus]PSL48594.1 uncharacterized protein DUF2848 [Salsuginibacillus halophilus]
MGVTKDTLETLRMQVQGNPVDFTVSDVICIGYSGRNQEKVKEHIEELAEIGIPRPDRVPALFPMRRSSLLQGGPLEVNHLDSSGEAEPVLIFGEDEEDVYLSLGSDHTDRDLETVSIAKSKQVCDKPLSREAWKLSEVLPHWDELKLKTEIRVEGAWQTYQAADATAIMHFDDVRAYLKEQQLPLKQAVYYIGTVPLLDGFKYGDAYRMQLHDPVLDRTLVLTYEVKPLEN